MEVGPWLVFLEAKKIVIFQLLFASYFVLLAMNLLVLPRLTLF